MNKSALTTFILSLYLAILGGGRLGAQNVGIKTNLLYDATATFNLGLEVGLAPRLTLDISANYNPWIWSGGQRWKHWMIQPELRWWTCDRFAGHFLGLHALGGPWNFGYLKNSLRMPGTDLSPLSGARYEGWGVGAGLAYGYALILSRRWNLELEAGLGYIYALYRGCTACGKDDTWLPHHYFGPTKLGISLVYVF